MFTCVIPTLWKSPRIVRLVKELCACPSVGEVIIIDNAASDRSWTTNIARRLLIEDHVKLKRVDMQKNIYVNPAWNLGIEIAKYNDIALVNDDVNFNADVFKIFDDGSLSKYGAVGMAIENYKLNADEVFRINPQIHRDYGWGCVIFLNKKNYIPIPNDLLIWCGDDWLALHMPIHFISGLKIDTKMSTTSDSEVNFGPIKDRDRETFRKKYLKQKPEIWR